jgi:hypothetical protein
MDFLGYRPRCLLVLLQLQRVARSVQNAIHVPCDSRQKAAVF